MADSRTYEIQLVETLRSIGRALGVAGLSSSGSSSSASSSISSNELIVAINGIISRLETNKSYLDILLERLEYDPDKEGFHLKTGLFSDSYVVAAASADFSPGGGGGSIAVYTLPSLESTTFDPASEADTFNAYTIQSLHTRIKALEQSPGGVSSVAGLTGDIAASDLFTALGLGTAATRAVGAVENANTGLVTGGDVYSFVNSSVATATATFRGTNTTATTEADFLAWADALTHDLNDYVFWSTTDAYGNTVYKRYKYDGTQWVFEYDLNNSSFTAAQWAAINSGITYQKITGYDTIVGYFTNGVLGTDNIPQLPTSKITDLDTTLTSLGNRTTELEKMFIKVSYTVGQETRYYLKLNPAYYDGIAAEGFGVFAASANFTPGGGGGGADLGQVWQSLQNAASPVEFATNLKIAQAHLPSLSASGGLTASYGGTTLADSLSIGIDSNYKLPTTTEWASKADASALSAYALTSSLGSMAYASTSNYMEFVNVNSAYVGAGFSDSSLSRIAASAYIEFWDAAGGWFNFRVGSLSSNNGGIYVGNNAVYHAGNFVSGVNYQAPISAGTGITISNNTVSVTANTYAPYNSAGYLPLIGGTLTNSTFGFLSINRTGSGGPSIAFQNNGSTLGYIGFSASGTLRLTTSDNTDYPILHAGNYSSYALPLSGGAMSNTNLVTNLNADLLDGIDSGTFIYGRALSNYNANELYNCGFWMMNGSATGLPSGGASNGCVLVLPYRKASGNSTVDWAGQLFLPNGDNAQPYLFYRTGMANSYNGWVKVWGNNNAGTTSYSWSASSLTLAGSISGATNIDSLLYFDTTNSRVGIGTTSPAYLLDVSGVINASTGVRSPGYGVFAASASSSDERLKDGIVSISPERAWSVLMQLKPREWTWNANYYQAGKRGAGLVAQEVEPVLPFSVLNEDKYLHLTYDVMHGFEIAGLQDHEIRLRAAEKEISTLKEENERLRTIINNY